MSENTNTDIFIYSSEEMIVTHVLEEMFMLEIRSTKGKRLYSL